MSGPCPRPVYQGLTGFVVGNGIRLLAITGWELRLSAEPFQWNDHSARGTLWSIATVKSGVGSFRGMIPRPLPGAIIGLGSLVLQLRFDEFTFFEFDALISDISYTVDIASGVPVGAEAQFLTNGYIVTGVAQPPVPPNPFLLFWQGF